MRKIFFYGLFMDRSPLVDRGLQPEQLGPAALPGYRIHIGERATLVPAEGARAYGLVMGLSDAEARDLYAEPSVQAYVPERVRVELLATGEALEVDCYNLPLETDLAGANPEYATVLSRLAETLEFDPAYVAEIAAFDEES